MEKAMQERESYRDVLEELAISRGFEGAEEVARQAAELSPGYTARALLEKPRAGFGCALDAVLRMSDAEKRRLTAAFERTFLNPPRS